MAFGVLHVTAAEGGGADRYIRDLAAHVRGEHWIWHVGAGIVEDVAHDGYFRAPGGDDAARFARDAGIALLHLHGLGRECLAVRQQIALPFVVTLHDVAFCAPRAFAGDLAVDAAVVQASAAALRDADAVIVPSQFIAGLVATHAPGVAVQLIEPGIDVPAAHARSYSGEDAGAIPDEFVHHALPLRIGIAGAIGPHKGGDLLPAIAAQLAPLGVTLVVVGYTGETLARGWQAPNLWVHGPYADGTLESWLDAYAIRTVLFANRMPESFSYTLSEAWAAGRTVIVPDAGALGERVERHGGGWRLREGFDAADAAALVARLASPQGSQERARVESALDDGDLSRIPTLAHMSEAFDALYARLIASRRGDSAAITGAPTPAEANSASAGGTAAGAPQAEAAALAPLLAANLDGSVFRAELVRLAEELSGLRGWSAKQAADVAELKLAVEALADENRQLRDVRDAFEQMPDFIKRQLLRRVYRGRD